MRLDVHQRHMRTHRACTIHLHASAGRPKEHTTCEKARAWRRTRRTAHSLRPEPVNFSTGSGSAASVVFAASSSSGYRSTVQDPRPSSSCPPAKYSLRLSFRAISWSRTVLWLRRLCVEHSVTFGIPSRPITTASTIAARRRSSGSTTMAFMTWVFLPPMIDRESV